MFEQDLEVLFECIKLLLLSFQLVSDLLETSLDFFLVHRPKMSHFRRGIQDYLDFWTPCVPAGILEKQNWLQMSQVFSVSASIIRCLAFQGFYRKAVTCGNRLFTFIPASSRKTWRLT